MIPVWLTNLSILMLALGGACSLIIAAHLALGHKQHMRIMNAVWPLTALFGTVVSLWAYFRYGRLAEHAKAVEARARDEALPSKKRTPFPMMVVKGTAHCGAGCALGDICAEFLALGFPAIAIGLGWKSLFPAGHHGKIFAVWILDYLFAFAFGVLFQYLTIKPMRGLSPAQGLVQALKADTLSLTAWQIGMYGFMAFAHFFVFVRVWNASITPSMPAFWFAMQIAMLFGFATSYPINWWLIRVGVKEAM
ncbi:MAG TPA: DUF4396 domain-containing protein [Woeseiaceae bacterium]|jgi:hypothetical protein|nr:DUF4396 domain-containing protein [Woeseiaceae bacterium]